MEEEDRSFPEEGGRLYSIKDFAKYTGLRQSVLRYYDEIGLFSPARRGENGYRYYSPYQIVPLNMLRVFIGLETPLKEVKTLASGRTPERVLKVLSKQERKFDADARQIQEAYAVAHIYREMLMRAVLVNEDEIEEREMNAVPLFVGQDMDEAGQKDMFKSFVSFCRYAKKSAVSLNYPIGGVYSDFGRFESRPNLPSRYFSLYPAGADSTVKGLYLSGFARGFYGQLGDLPARLKAHAKKRGLTPCGPVYVIYLLDEVSMQDPNRYLAQVSALVTAKKLQNNRKIFNSC